MYTTPENAATSERRHHRGRCMCFNATARVIGVLGNRVQKETNMRQKRRKRDERRKDGRVWGAGVQVSVKGDSGANVCSVPSAVGRGPQPRTSQATCPPHRLQALSSLCAVLRRILSAILKSKWQ